MADSGTFNFWIRRESIPATFSPGVHCRLAEFQLHGRNCVICSNGPTIAATLDLGTDHQVRIFRVPFTANPESRRQLVTIGWSKGQVKVLLDSKLLVEIPLPQAFPESPLNPPSLTPGTLPQPHPHRQEK